MRAQAPGFAILSAVWLRCAVASGQSVAPAQSLAPPAPTPPVVASQPAPAPQAEQPLATLDYADFSWMPANYAAPTSPLQAGAIRGEVRVDSAYHFSFARPQDNSLSGSTSAYRHNEMQLTHVGLGADVLYHGAHARVMTQFGLYSTATPRNDASPARGQWQLADAYRYISEAYAGYRLPVLRGINLQAGLFMSYVGLWSYYSFDNWTSQPSYVSANTPWYFQGIRAQIYVSKTLKIEPWLVNGWQAYGSFNRVPGVGGQVAWRPKPSLALVFNQYYGSDTPGIAARKRYHSDSSVMVKYYERPGARLSRAAASLTVDAGCEWGGGVRCSTQHFLGFMAYNRVWFADNHVAFTVGGGAMKNPGRYLMLLPAINGATAASNTQTYLTANPGDAFVAWDMQTSIDILPVPYATLRLEFTHRSARVGYFTGRGGVTPPGGNQGRPGSEVLGWTPDLQQRENRMTVNFMLKM